MNLTAEESARFRSKYEVMANECWQWLGPLDRDGYGMFYLRRRGRRAHRVGWFSMYGEIPDGMFVNHKCRNRGCVNPRHLELVTPRDNVLKDSRAASALNARKTTCPKGHPYDRTYKKSNGSGFQRYCSRCESEKKRRLRRKWIAEDTLKV